MTGAQLINYAVVILLAVVSGTGGWATLQFVLNRRGVKAAAAKEEAEAEVRRREAAKAEAERIAFLQEIERKAYAAAEASQARRYSTLEQDYNDCRSGLRELRDAVRPLITILDAIMARIWPQEGQDVSISVTYAEAVTVRRALEEAHRHV